VYLRGVALTFDVLRTFLQYDSNVASLDVKFLQSPGLDICKSPDNRWDLAYGGALVIDGLPMGYVSPGPLRPYLLEIKGVFYREGESFFHIEIKNHTA